MRDRSVGSQRLAGGAPSAPRTEHFQSLGNPLPAAGEDPPEEAGRCEFLPGCLCWAGGCPLLPQEGWHAQAGLRPFTLLKGFSAQWGSSQIKRHFYCRVVSTVMKTVHGVFPGTGAVGGPG